MPRKKQAKEAPSPRWMTQCDVIRYNLKMPDALKRKIKKEAAEREMDMSSYICGVLAGEIKRPAKKSGK